MMKGMLLLTILPLLVVTRVRSSPAGPQVPGFFIFGDSLVDNGNNNNLLSLARANYMPYGVDFPQGASGRFTNGRTTVDVIAQLLGFRNFIPTNAGARGVGVLRGLNFASGASGIREETGNNLGQHYPFDQQVDQFRRMVRYMRGYFRYNDTQLGEYLNRCIFYIGMGSNDYLNNYFMPNLYRSSYDYDTKTYAAILLEDYSRQISDLYDLGARKVAIVGVGQIGCIPYELARFNRGNNRKGDDRCNDTINQAITIYNKGLVKMVDRFNNQLPGAKFIFINTYESSKDLVTNAVKYGFDVIDKGCCGVGRNNGQITCLPLQRPCGARASYLFWDAFHPTEKANILYAQKAYNSSSTNDVYPVNIRQLAMA